VDECNRRQPARDRNEAVKVLKDNKKMQREKSKCSERE